MAGTPDHIDPDDRLELAVRAYELHLAHGSITRVREYLAADEVSIRVLGGRRLLARSTVALMISEGREAERYEKIVEASQQREDSAARLAAMISAVQDYARVHGVDSWDDMVKFVELLRRLEKDRGEVEGWRRGTLGVGDLPANIDPAMVAMITAMRQRAIETGRAGPDGVPTLPPVVRPHGRPVGPPGPRRLPPDRPERGAS